MIENCDEDERNLNTLYFLTMELDIELETGCPALFEKEIQVDVIEEDKGNEKKLDLKPKFLAPLIDFDALLKELRSKSSEKKPTKGTQTKTKKFTQIKNIFKSNFFRATIVSLVLFLFSTTDVITDGNLTYSFYYGTYYVKRFPSRPDSK